ncbi:MAG: ATP-binding cassette domain-containing protein [Lachnospiraceae bacterium]|nr:ATP-binding cassette domain-containing protein [Lachnospiraceae bacterium]
MIKVVDLNKRFEDKIIFDNLNVTINTGEFVVVAGKSGCGKTTFLNMLGGIEKADTGKIVVDDLEITKEKNLKDYYLYKVGFLFQNFALVENRTVEENIEFVQKKSRTGRSVEEVLKQVGLEDKIREKVYKLSGGEQQRVALARLLYKKCDIILADEPTACLDAANADIVLDLLHQMNKQGKTVVLVTHNEMIISKEKRVIRL